MTKDEFIRQLDKHLRKLDREEREEIIADYHEHFACAKAEGKAEEETARNLGEPKRLSREFLAQKYIRAVEKKRSVKNVFKALIATAGLGMLNVLYILCVMAAGYILLASLYISAVAVAAAGLAGVVSLLIFSAHFPETAFLFFLFGLIAACASGVLMFIGLIYTGRAFNRMNMRFFRSNNERINKRGDNDE